MQVFEEGFPDDAIIVHTDSQLLQHRIHIGLQFLLASLSHEQDHSSAFINVAPNILQLLGAERLPRASQEQ
jgi:hypothetical protein